MTLNLMLGVASGVLHPAQGCKILVVLSLPAPASLCPVLWVRDVSSNTWSQKCLKSNEKTLNSRNIVFSHFLVDPGLLVLNKFIKIKNTSDYMWATAWSWKTSGCCQNWIESNTRDLSEKYGIGMLLGHDAAVDESGSTSSTHSTAVRDELTWDGSSDFF